MNDDDQTTKEHTVYFDDKTPTLEKLSILGFEVVFKDKNVPKDTKQDFNVIISKIELIWAFNWELFQLPDLFNEILHL